MQLRGEFDGGEPDDGPGFGFALDNPGSSIVSPIRRRLDGDIWCVAMGLRGHTENGINKAVEYLSEVGMDEVFLLSLFPLLSHT
jgi:hypothetical protein